MHDSAAAARMAEIKAGLERHLVRVERSDDGHPRRNGTAYYRIQGPHLVIEYAPQPIGGDPAMHVHTIYRDPTNDYGRKAAGEMSARGL